MSYKRPNPRPYSRVPTQFTSSSLPGGGVVSQWTTVGVPKARIPSGHPSLVGQILDKMRHGSNPAGPKRTEWSPPVEYEFVAKNTPDPEAYIQRCKAWYEAHPTDAKSSRDPPPVLNFDPILETYKKYGSKVPPIPELEKAWRLAGYSEPKIQKALAYYKRMEETADARQEALDLNFAKFPSASKPTPKPKIKKVIKVVKKKMPGSSNE